MNRHRNTAIIRLRAALIILLVLSLGVRVGVLLATRPLEPRWVGDTPNTVRVLFIGNSYTYVNNLPGLLIELAGRETKPLEAEMIVEGGATLAKHWAEGKALTAIRRIHWNYVVLQEQSTLGSDAVINGLAQIGDPASFRTAVRQFDAAIRATGARTILFLTWARQNAPENQALLTRAYMDIARELHVMVAPVGLAWQAALKTDPGLVLHQSDGSHPDSAGSYLAACVFYATLYHKSPTNLPAHVVNSLVDDSGNLQVGDVDLKPADALLLQQIAWQVVSTQ